MKLRTLRFPALLLAFILFTMSACAILQAVAERASAPSCHATTEQSSDQESNSSTKFCCETGLIPNPNKSPVFREDTNLMLVKIIEEPSLNVFSSFDVHIGSASSGPPSVPLNLPLRI